VVMGHQQTFAGTEVWIGFQSLAALIGQGRAQASFIPLFVFVWVGNLDTTVRRERRLTLIPTLIPCSFHIPGHQSSTSFDLTSLHFTFAQCDRRTHIDLD